MEFLDRLKSPYNQYDRDTKALREAVFNLFERLEKLEAKAEEAPKKKKKDTE